MFWSTTDTSSILAIDCIGRLRGVTSCGGLVAPNLPASTRNAITEGCLSGTSTIVALQMSTQATNDVSGAAYRLENSTSNMKVTFRICDLVSEYECPARFRLQHNFLLSDID